MFDFSSMAVECDKTAMAVWQALHEPGLGSDLAHEPGLGGELRTGGTMAREQARRWRGHVRSAKGGSEVCTSSASTCVRLGRVLKNHYICLKEFKISTLIRDITFMREFRNSYVNN